jgi:hypothetical protein
MVCPLDTLATSRPDLAATVRGYEAELDALWPPWRDPDAKVRRFKQLEYDTLARLKWLLKRRDLLLHQDHGIATPRDWVVKIVPSRSNSRMCFAHPIIPAASVHREVTSEPPSPLRVHPNEVST